MRLMPPDPNAPGDLVQGLCVAYKSAREREAQMRHVTQKQKRAKQVKDNLRRQIAGHVARAFPGCAAVFIGQQSGAALKTRTLGSVCVTRRASSGRTSSGSIPSTTARVHVYHELKLRLLPYLMGSR
jgi:hypothetical protein